MQWQLIAAALALPACLGAQAPACACGAQPLGPPASRTLAPYANTPEDLRPFSKFTTPYHEYFQDLVEHNGAARDLPDFDLKDLSAIRIVFTGSLNDHPQQV